MKLEFGYGTGQNNNGNLQWQKITRSGALNQQDYLYDEVNRLTSAAQAGPNSWSQTYGYDRWGNRWLDTYSAATLPTPSAEVPRVPGDYVFSGSVTNRITKNGFHYDEAGNLDSAGGVRTSTHDAENRQVTVTPSSGGTSTYVYDGDGRRVKKIVPTLIDGSVVPVTTIFVYDAFGQLAAEYGGPPVKDQGTRYLFGDHLGSTRLVLKSTGEVDQQYDYLPFGEELGGAYPTGDLDVRGRQRLEFTAKERDAETGLDYFGARYMSSAQGRFTSPDPDNFDARLGQPQSWNMYVYTWNNPLKYKDDDGRAVNLGLAAIGAGVGFVTNFAGSAISQQITTGHVDWSTAAKVGGVGAATGSLAGLTFGASLVAQGASAIAIGTLGNVANGIGSRAVSGDDAFSMSAVETDAELGAVASTGGALLTGLGTAIGAGTQPKLPNPLGTVQKQLRRMALLKAWNQQRENLSSQFSAAGAVIGSLVTNTGASIYSAYQTHQNDLAFMWLQQQSAAQKPLKACVETSDSASGSRSKVCE